MCISLTPYPYSRLPHSHEGSNPELSVHQIQRIGDISSESSHNTRHEIAYNNKIGNSHSKALQRNCCVKDDSRSRVRDLAERKERTSPSVQISRASRLQV